MNARQVMVVLCCFGGALVVFVPASALVQGMMTGVSAPIAAAVQALLFAAVLALFAVPLGLYMLGRRKTEKGGSVGAATSGGVSPGSVLDALEEVLFLTDTAGRIVAMNAAAEAVTGLRAAGAIGKQLDALVLYPEGESGGQIEGLMAQVLETGSRAETGPSLVVLGPSGGERIVTLTCTLVSSDDGEPQGLVVSVTDLTRETETRDRLQSIAENLPSAVLYQIVSGPNAYRRFTYVGENLERQYGIAVADVLRDPVTLYGAIRPDCIPRLALAEEEALEGLKPLRCLVPLHLPSGKEAWFNLSSTPRPSTDGFTVWDGVMFDVTEQQLADEALRSERDLLSGIFEASASAILVISADGHIVRANTRAEFLLGLSNSHLVNRAFDDPVFRVTTFDGSPLPATEYPFARVMAERAPIQGMEHAVVHLDGRTFYLTVNGAPLLGADGSIEAAVFIFEDVTLQRRALSRLKKSEDRLRRAQEVARVGMWEMDYETRKLQCSDVLLEIAGIEASDGGVSYGRLMGLTHPDDVGEWRTGLAEALQRGDAYTAVYRVVRPDGRVVWVRTETAPPEHNPDGTLRRLFGITQDITDLKQQEEALRQRAQFLEHLPHGVWYTRHDLAGTFTDVSSGITTSLGYTPEEFKAHYATFLTDDPVNETAEEHTQRSLQGEYQPPYLASIYHKNGSRQWIEIQEVPVFDASGHVVAVEGLGINVTSRIEAEQRLTESEERLRLVLSDTPMIGVQATDNAGIVTFWNKGSESLYGYTRAEAIGRNIVDLIVPAPLRGEVRGLIAEMCRSGVASAPSEYELMTKDGNTVTVHTSHAVLQRPGRAPEMFSFDVDLSGYKRAEEERERLREQLNQAQKMESIGRLAGGVAHDFNNMLNVIVGHAELVLADLRESNPIREDLEQIHEAALRSAELTRQLLAFARRQAATPRVLDLNRTLDAMFKMLRRLIGENIELAWKPAPIALPTLIDPVQVDQILANLVVNGRDAIAGSGTVTIETVRATFDEEHVEDGHAFAPASYTVIAVSDTGSGMDAATCARVFEPFYTTKAAGEGTGLGLATVYGIVRQNGGFIRVYSEVGHGSTFRVYLPYQDIATTREERDSAAAPPPAGTGETILLVEDEPSILRLGKRLLERMGYRVLAASGAAEALHLAETHVGKVDLLFSDVIMPEMNGRELAQEVLRRYPEVKHLFMSGYTADVIANQGVLDEGVNFIQKPFNYDDLARAVRDALEENPSVKEN